KSMAAEVLEHAEVSWQGVPGDRRWAFIRKGRVTSGFPWLTIRECPALWHYRPSFVQPHRPDKSRTMVVTPAGVKLDVISPELAAELGDGVGVIRNDRGFFDTMPLSVVTTQTVAALSTRVGAAVDALRFRPNLLIDGSSAQPYREDAWVGRVLRMGALRVRIDKRDQRCMTVNVDPVTARRSPVVLRTIARERDACLGVYASIVEPGRVAVGDPVAIEA
ncbi:MAG TPA: MOSC domain-containing protein, partial [Kofleriaceae bacterium]|nr:MOSC domain-containing protein [Kofleriaceae bacterium]